MKGTGEKMQQIEKPRRDIKPDAQAFDEIRIYTVPRYKTSGLSGDEWRVHAQVDFYRKGQKITSSANGTIEDAVACLPYYLRKATDDGKGYFAGEKNFCDQEGCAQEATITYKKKNDFCRSGHKTETLGVVIRKFCDDHKRRGDCGLDDSDSNYELYKESEVNHGKEDKEKDEER